MEEENWLRLFKSGLMMFKSTVVYLISTLWIGSWGLFAVDEVSSTISHLVEKHKGHNKLRTQARIRHA